MPLARYYEHSVNNSGGSDVGPGRWLDLIVSATDTAAARHCHLAQPGNTTGRFSGSITNDQIQANCRIITIIRSVLFEQ